MLGDGSRALRALLSRAYRHRGYGFQPLVIGIRLPSKSRLKVVQLQSKQVLDRDIQQFGTHP